MTCQIPLCLSYQRLQGGVSAHVSYEDSDVNISIECEASHAPSALPPVGVLCLGLVARMIVASTELGRWRAQVPDPQSHGR